MVLRLILIVITLTFSTSAFSAEPVDATAEKLTVAVAECPPFVITENGQYTGLAVYLWERIGTEMGLNWNYVEYPLAELLD